MSGAEIGGIFWVVFAAAVISLAAYFYFNNNGEVVRAKPIIVICSLVALAIMAYKYFDFRSTAQCSVAGLNRLTHMAGEANGATLNQNPPLSVSFKIRYGGIGAVLGFALSLLGGLLLGEDERRKPSRRAII